MVRLQKEIETKFGIADVGFCYTSLKRQAHSLGCPVRPEVAQGILKSLLQLCQLSRILADVPIQASDRWDNSKKPIAVS